MQAVRVLRGAALVSGVALIIVLSQLDLLGLQRLLDNLNWWILGGGAALLVVEALASTARLWWLAGRREPFQVAVKVNAWYMLYLMLLPARLGELAVIGLMGERLRQSTGAATGSIVTQRIFDVLVLAACFVLFAAIAASVEVALLLIVGFPLLVLVLLRLGALLTLAARCLQRWAGRTGLMRASLRLVLQARTWCRQHLDYASLGVMFVLTVVKWTGSLLALVLILQATGIGLGTTTLLPVVIIYVFLSIIPLQTLGGIGVTDVGLLALLVSLGIDSGWSAAVTLFCRLALISFTAAYAGAVLAPGAFARG